MAEVWLTDLDKARTSALNIAKTISGAGLKLEGRQSALVRGQLAQLKQDVSGLERLLMTMSQNTQAYGITKKELSRRGDMLGQLSEQVERMSDCVKNTAQRQQLLRSSQAGGPSSSNYADSRNGNSHGSQGSAPSKSHDELMSDQDDALDFLQTTVRNLKEMGSGISKEIDTHCEMLGELEERADKTRERVRTQHSRLNDLMENTSTCALWLYITLMSCILFVLMVFL
mmetsp:Transcript_41525/g.89733  ORF Transcript_41525/g.89733 Transcript_41525/m.89733 type:complete len:228 (+) Transcript_41525:21-704(+)